MSLAVQNAPSPNADARPGPVDTLILHYTGMQSAEAAIARLRDPQSRVSSHYVVDEDGAVWRLVPEYRRAWHAGVSGWRGRTGLNDTSIGIEIVNPGHEWGYRPFPPAQVTAVQALCLGILGRHAIPRRNVVGHSDVAPDRKEDPGELFPWQDLAAAGIGLWPADGDMAVPDNDDAVAAALTAIGYPVFDLPVLVRAFQRHWRPEDVSGVADLGTRQRMMGVLAAGGAPR